MISIIGALNTYTLSLSRGSKHVLLLVADFLLTLCALWLAFALRLAEIWPVEHLQANSPVFILIPFVMLGSLTFVGFYQDMLRYMGFIALLQLFLGSIITIPFIYAVATLFNVEMFPRSVPLIFGPLICVFIALFRGAALSYVHWAIGFGFNRERILVIGYLEACLQVVSAVKRSNRYRAVGLVDVEKNSVSKASGFKILTLTHLKKHIREKKIDSLVVAMDGLDPSRQKRLLNQLSEYHLKIRVIPSIDEFLKNDAINFFREIELTDLLGRDHIPAIPELINSSVTSQVVLVTGAGGSIGSEICRQCVGMGARTLILLDSSEYNLYTVDAELSSLVEESSSPVEIIPCIGSVLDQDRMLQIMVHYQVNTVFHAAAYKHVPLLESSPMMAFTNNALGSWVVAKAAVAGRVQRFVLVSTDKAVRPTNVMGASKRLAELAVETIAKSQSHVIFSSVRFGNVLGSSGSVIPLFTRQIQSGGPVTITDPMMTRYFMTIPEAACLVIQAASISDAWAIFVLDMGEAVPIKTLAEHMIHLSGHVVQNESNPTGIAIKTIGVRPGEKLYEELSISGELHSTIHPKIRMTKDSFDDLDMARFGRIMQSLEEGEINAELFVLLNSSAVSYTGNLGNCPEAHAYANPN